MELTELQKHWDAFGEDDPLWAILSLPEKRGNRWDLDEFFRIGREHVDDLLGHVRRVGLSPRPGAALDFGCGVGRLTQALLRHFETCHGVDIAPSMIERARKLNRHGGRATYLVNDRDDLGVFPDDRFDFVLSLIVLQHMRPEYAKRYVRDFVRVLRPGGAAVFQVPAGPRPHAELAEKFPDLVQTGPLPPEGFRAWLAADPPPAGLTPRQRFPLRVRVRNVGEARWARFGLSDTRFGIRLGTRWFDERGRDVDQVDERLFLDRSLAPGEETECTLSPCAPAQPGRYLLEVDLAQEYVGWFRDKGSRSLTFGVEVVAPAPAPALSRGDEPPGSSAPAAFEPRIEMYWVPKDEVIATVAAAGGRVVHAQEIIDAPTDLNFYYIVTK